MEVVIVVVVIISFGIPNLFDVAPNFVFYIVALKIWRPASKNKGYFLDRWSVSRVKQDVLTLGSAPGVRYRFSIFEPPSIRQKLSFIFSSISSISS
jgi:hypothetical protein